jgi:hypothetical protein
MVPRLRYVVKFIPVKSHWKATGAEVLLLPLSMVEQRATRDKSIAKVGEAEDSIWTAILIVLLISAGLNIHPIDKDVIFTCTVDELILAGVAHQAFDTGQAMNLLWDFTSSLTAGYTPRVEVPQISD